MKSVRLLLPEAEETISLFKLISQQNRPDKHKVISLKKVTELNKEKHHSNNLNAEEQHASLRMEIENKKYQLASLERQREKMLHELKEAIEKEKQAWIEQKKKEEEQAKEIGYKIGFDQGREEALTEYNSLIEKANMVITTAQKDYYQIVGKHEETIIQLAISIAEKVIDQKIDKKPEWFVSIVKKAVEELKDHSHVTIYVHPSK